MEKWSSNSLRRAGLCEDHFSQEAFTNNKGLKRTAVPIPFNEDNELNNERKKIMKKEQAFQIKEINTKEISMRENTSSVSFAPNNENNEIINEQLVIEERPIRCYQSAHLHFDSFTEEEDTMEWMNIEPSIEPNSTPLLCKKKNKT